MSPTDLPTHPDERDLRNFARDELGGQKKQRILAHCRDCPDCADRLIEATREHAPEAERRPLSRWQWASIVLFVLALVAAVGAMVWLLRSLSSPEGMTPRAGEPGIEAPEPPDDGAEAGPESGPPPEAEAG